MTIQEEMDLRVRTLISLLEAIDRLLKESRTNRWTVTQLHDAIGQATALYELTQRKTP